VVFYSYFSKALRPDSGSWLPLNGVRRSHSLDTPQLGRTPLEEWSARSRNLYLATLNTRNRPTPHAFFGIRTRNPSKQAAAYPPLRPHGHCDRQNQMVYVTWLYNLRCTKVSCGRNFNRILSFAAFFFYWRYNPLWVCILQPSGGAIASSLTRFLDHTQRRATIGRTPLDEWSARRRDLYLTTHNTHNRQISMPSVGFEPTIAAGERP